jgi:hypothetical protein
LIIRYSVTVAESNTIIKINVKGNSINKSKYEKNPEKPCGRTAEYAWNLGSLALNVQKIKQVGPV